MRKSRTLEELRKIQDWIFSRKSVKKRLRESRTLHDIIAIPNVLTEENIEAAREYEWSMLGPTVRSPQEGDIYITTRDINTLIDVDFDARYSATIEGVISKGTKLVIGYNNPKPFLIVAYPYELKEQEQKLIPEKFLRDNAYKGFAFVFKISELKDGLQFKSDAIGT